MPDNPDRPNNLWDFVPGEHQAHGPFDDRSHTSSPQVFADLHRGWFIGGGALLLAAGVALASKRK